MFNKKPTKSPIAQISQNIQTYYFQLRPSHLSVSLNFTKSIKPNTYYQLHLIKDDHQSSQVNLYQNLPILAKVYHGKIIFSNVHLSFSAQYNRGENKAKQFWLKLYEVRGNGYGEDTEIGQFKLEVLRYIHEYKKQKKYFYEQCAIHPQVYLTFQVFIQKGQVQLLNYISLQTKRQKQKMKQHIIDSLESKRKVIQNIAANKSQSQTDIKNSIKAHLTILNHLEKGQQHYQKSIQGKKILLKQELGIKNAKKRNTKDLMKQKIQEDQSDEFQLRHSEIQIKQQYESPSLHLSNMGNSSTNIKKSNNKQHQKGQKSKIKGFQSGQSSKISKNIQNQFSIHVKSPQQLNFDISQREESSIKLNSENSSSVLSLNNQYQNAVNMAILQRQKQSNIAVQKQTIRKSSILQKLNYGYENTLKSSKGLNMRQNKNRNYSVRSNLSEINIQSEEIPGEVRKMKFSILGFVVVTILMFIYLIDHPYFDIFEGKNDAVIDDDDGQESHRLKKKRINNDSEYKKNSKHKKGDNKHKR